MPSRRSFLASCAAVFAGPLALRTRWDVAPFGHLCRFDPKRGTVTLLFSRYRLRSGDTHANDTYRADEQQWSEDGVNWRDD